MAGGTDETTAGGGVAGQWFRGASCGVLGGVWDSPKAEEIAAGIDNTVTTARARVAEAYQAAVWAEAAERGENTETVDDDSDEAKPKWDT